MRELKEFLLCFGGFSRCVKQSPTDKPLKYWGLAVDVSLGGSAVPTTSAVASWYLSGTGRLRVWGRNLAEEGAPSPGGRERTWWR